MHNFNLNFIPEQKGVYIVGGSVRDALMGQSPKDYDIAVTGDARIVAEEIAAQTGSRVIEIGKPGKKIYRVVSGRHTYDISPAKSPLIAEDLKQRDFTINAMAFDVVKKKLIDPLNGRRDIDARTVQTVSPDALKNDPIRLLRAFRIASVADFDISMETLTEIRKNAHFLPTVAGERIREEWIKLTGTSGSFPHVRQMADTGLLSALFPEMDNLKKCPQNAHHAFDVLEHSLETYRHLENVLRENTPPLSDRLRNAEMAQGPCGVALIKHAALLHDIGKPAVRTVDENGKIHFYGHETTGSAMTRTISDRLCFSTVQKNYVHFLVQHHLRPLFLFIALSQGRKKNTALTRFFVRTMPFTFDLMLLFTGDMMGKNINQNPAELADFTRNTIESYFNAFYPKLKQLPLVNGQDLIDYLGLQPSPIMAEILQKIEIQRLSGKMVDKNEALAYAEKYIKSKNLS